MQDAARTRSPLDLHHARPAVAVGPIAGLVGVAEMGDPRSAAFRHLPYRLVRPGLDLDLVEQEAKRLAHSSSSRKYFKTEFSGFAAACPRPQIEASVIVRPSSSSSASSHLRRDMSATAFSVPTRHGVH